MKFFQNRPHDKSALFLRWHFCQCQSSLYMRYLASSDKFPECLNLLLHIYYLYFIEFIWCRNPPNIFFATLASVCRNLTLLLCLSLVVNSSLKTESVSLLYLHSVKLNTGLWTFISPKVNQLNHLIRWCSWYLWAYKPELITQRLV